MIFMKSTKFVFILSSFHVRCIKRIKEFIDNGYEVEVYGFSRENLSVNLDAEIIGVFDTYSSHVKRIPTIVKGIRSVLKRKECDDVVLYVFGLDIAMWLSILNRKHPFFYEESDLYHTYIGSRYVRNILEYVDKCVIKRSLLTVFTSEGFALYHFGDSYPKNITIIPNRLSNSVLECKSVIKRPIDIKHLSIGFVGAIRFKAVMYFANYFLRNFPQHEFHFYGMVTDEVKKQFEEIVKFPNCYYHGKFSTPNDLPNIYSQIDLVLSTYDTEYINVKFAEPNKFYESLYFETPIIVSEDTFLGEKVRRNNSGYVINALDDESIKQFVNSLTVEDYLDKVANIRRIPKANSINNNVAFFGKLESILCDLPMGTK